jgi:hypothetical protein
MRILFLDDERLPENVTWFKYPENAEFTIVRNYAEFQVAVSKIEKPFIISFDHDLGIVPDQSFLFRPVLSKTGLDCIHLLGNMIVDGVMTIDGIDCVFHTMNPIGKQNMLSYWKSLQKYIGDSNGSFI